MGCEKDLAEGEGLLVMEEVGQVKADEMIAKKVSRCVMTEIAESVRSFGRILQRGKRQSDCGGLNLFSMRDMN